MNPYLPTLHFDSAFLTALAAYNTGVERAVVFNRGRELRERRTNSWWQWNANARRRKS